MPKSGTRKERRMLYVEVEAVTDNMGRMAAYAEEMDIRREKAEKEGEEE